ncbi:MAG: MBL fold metallo-hydrolase [Ruminococcaceae bacterium]|nr:MBL fold metallo-hydrolase [Oscillospiraceae bacterium]
MKIEALTVGSLGTNCYILYDEASKEAMIVDPGGSEKKIEEKIISLDIKPKYIVLTHAHCDHIEALDYIKSQTNATVCVGSGDYDALNDSFKNLCAFFGSSSPCTKADIILKENDTLALGNAKLKVIETPGHTPGCISLYTDGILISGDTLFLESVGRCDFPGGSSAKLKESIKEKLYVLPKNTLVYPGHGDATTIEHEINNNPFIW